MEVPFEGFAGFLNWLFGPTMGGFVILTWFASWALEDLAWWQGLTSKTRSLIFYLGSIAIGVGAFFLLQNEQLVATIEPYFQIIVAATGVWLSSQVVHKVNKALTPETEEPQEPLG